MESPVDDVNHKKYARIRELKQNGTKVQVNESTPAGTRRCTHAKSPPQQILFEVPTIAQWNRLPANVFTHNSLDAFKGALQGINLTNATFSSGTSDRQCSHTTTPVPLHTPS